MKHKSPLIHLSFLALLLLSYLSVFAQTYPQRSNTYVNDYAGILSRDEYDQLCSDVKSMCDYYSTQIVVAIVPTFDGLSIDEYAEGLGKTWKVTQNDGMLVLVKPKSNFEKGEAMLLASPDLGDVFSADVCSEIVNDNMIPYFKENNYYGGIDAVLEYMNNMSGTESTTTSTTKESSNKKIYIIVGVILLLGIVVFVIRNKKEADREVHDNNENNKNKDNNIEANIEPTLNRNVPKDFFDNGNAYQQDRSSLQDTSSAFMPQNDYNNGYTDTSHYNPDTTAMVQLLTQMQNNNMSQNNLMSLMGYMNGGNNINQNNLAALLQQMNGYNMDPSTMSMLLQQMNSNSINPTTMMDIMQQANNANSGMDVNALLRMMQQKKRGGKVGSFLAGAAAGVGGTLLTEKIINNKNKEVNEKPKLGGNGGKPTLGGGNKPNLGGNNKPNQGGGKPSLGSKKSQTSNGNSASGSW